MPLPNHDFAVETATRATALAGASLIHRLQECGTPVSSLRPRTARAVGDARTMPSARAMSTGRCDKEARHEQTRRQLLVITTTVCLTNQVIQFPERVGASLRIGGNVGRRELGWPLE